ncbi:ribonuclease H-like domain-containing protein [Anaerobacillus isosaccharinicus]|uniref:Ribonuclease H-like domain-containing protein n=1 Tax=Anaerobacillus isosaccharinicus TaxID=1532552 RepID=A0A1S2L4W2_9BACI|nr:ribonuclease H-like domain-containing protein [Anaerobacillus isosaccharinicus]MBA5586934.1 ribonuclease H-like domain-containing protein [Anaerobacillus isosaccharinicus]QOY34860.1 ribonuclease H-like domain-containing protein [Anaerobacillus isosaccharinicus]
MSLKNKLLRMKGHMQLPEKREPHVETRTTDDGQDWSSISGTPLFLDEQWTIFREVHYPIDYKFGVHRFSELKGVIQLWNEADLNHPLAATGIKENQLVFFDTETTGLGTGTGNTIFLLGYCHIEDDVVKVKQFFLPGPAHEAAMYYHFLDDVQDLSNLVTYNGKAFDWPAVRTRHTLVRDKVGKLPKFGHDDLLHASRRLWKDTLPSCRLSIVEKEILSIERDGDTPGSLAPLLYFDYLREKDPKIIEGVLKHNEMDVLSLIVLYIHLSKKLLNKASTSMNEMYEVARWFEKEKEMTRATLLYEQVTKSQSPRQNDALLALGLIFKKEKKLEEAVDCFLQLADKESGPSVRACIELAKLYEHQFKDIEKAFFYTELAYHRQKHISRLLKERKLLQELKLRSERLNNKR